jgi:predicted HAD superfamily Cof-like phosphohydrolase
MEKYDFYQDIIKFNKMYGLPVNNKPTFLSCKRIIDFKNIITEEINEGQEIIDNSINGIEEIETLTDLADWLGDIIVYCQSEAIKHGIDLNKVLKIIMESNFSKLDKNGKPIYDSRNKILRGPNYFPPEPKIRELLKESFKK